MGVPGTRHRDPHHAAPPRIRDTARCGRCGEPRGAHRHYGRSGDSSCSLCPCPRFRARFGDRLRALAALRSPR